MKKVLLIALLAVFGISANAQILSSRTVTKPKSNTMWILRAGMTLNNATDNQGGGSAIGFDATIGFNKPISSSSVYWGMDLGVGTRGFSFKGYDDETYDALAYAVRFSPVTFGYKYAFTEDFKLDGHLGAYASYDFAHNDEAEGLDDFDAGVQVGIGAWWKRFNLDVTYQRGFCDMAGDSKSSNVMIRLGIAF